MDKRITELYMYIFSIKEFDHEVVKGNLGNNRGELIWRSNLKHLNLYESLRGDCDIIGWASADDPSNILSLLKELKSSIRGKGEIVHSFLSIYQRSPYLKNSLNIEKQINESRKKYIIAYPMSKSNDWYLLPYDQRKRIMDEHIRTAMTDPNNKDILSYTTYSFGIGDQEFVVIYETDSLYSWMKVTEKLREVEARKWIIKETPILTGIRIE
ncbi:chlorite dismutase family protein [Cuniculiplasma sp. SKW3]|uniref:chlorite dismutase family protein n=1 Tax=Cuniculiplasma sp. SKW3 TaxID=3400170 RepID=UPI003FD6168C